MNEKIFWVWNGWGLFFTVIVALFQFLFVFITIKMGPTPLRKPFALVSSVAIVLTFVFSGWIAGLLTLPIGIIGGSLLAGYCKTNKT